MGLLEADRVREPWAEPAGNPQHAEDAGDEGDSCIANQQSLLAGFESEAKGPIFQAHARWLKVIRCHWVLG